MPRGGYRPNSGRKKTENPKEQLNIHVRGDLLDYLKAHGATAVVEEAVPKTKAFREWLRDEKEKRKKSADT